MTPKILRMRDAPDYLGMSPRAFNEIVRPNVREASIGVQGIGFLRDDLDAWADSFFERNAIDKQSMQGDDVRCIGRRHANGGNSTWHARQSAASTSATVSGISTNSTKENGFKKALELVRGKKRKTT